MADNIDNLIEETVQFCIDYDKRGMTERVYRRVISSAIKKACEIGLPVESNKPKSAIEEAIEREVKGFWNNEKADTMYAKCTTAMLSRIVNLTLDEAKKVAKNYGYSNSGEMLTARMLQDIDALKVKE